MSHSRQAIFIADLGFGDAGKGTITDYLTRRLAADLIVRYNGGPQAAHNVVTPDIKHHTFAQFGSGMLLPWARTLLSRFMLINPLNMLKEERHLHDLDITNTLSRTLIDRRTLIITPFQKTANRLREIARAADRHGSCGEGIGETMADYLNHGNAMLMAGDLRDRSIIRKKLRFLYEARRAEISDLCHQIPDTEQTRPDRTLFTDERASNGCIEDCVDVYHYFSSCVELVDEAAIRVLLEQSRSILFEGAQGVLLDENYGFAPYTTWSTTTFANADTITQENDFTGEVIKLGVVRAYATRHGAGPFPTEDHALTRTLPDAHNTWNDWQQTFRVGHFDLVATRYARDVMGQLDYLAVTHLDRLETIPEWKICTGYRYQGEDKDLSLYFEHEGNRLKALKVHRQVDLTHQEQLTRRLWSATPEYQIFSQAQGQHTKEDTAAYLSLLKEQLSAPIAIVSRGPTAADKQCVRDLRGLA